MTNNTLILAKENRVMINEIKNDIKEIKVQIKTATNHLSKRLPGWATIIITILGSLVTGLVVASIK